MGIFKKPTLPGMTNGDPTVYTKGKTRTQDSTYRDVYADMRKERGNKVKPTSKAYVHVITSAFGVALSSFTFLGTPMLWMMGSKISELAGIGKSIEYLDAFKEIAFGSPFSVLPYTVAAGGTGLMYSYLKRNWDAQNVGRIHTDIDTYEDDAYIQQPEQMAYSFDIFPDAGAHSIVSPTAVLGHMMFSAKGIKKVSVPLRYEKTTEEHYEDGSSEVFLKGEFVLDDYGEPIFKTVPLIDEKFGDSLYTASLIPDGAEGKAIRKYFDTRNLMYNPKKVRDKTPETTVAEHINKHWTFPNYEIQRPAGAYIVDTEPNNTMVLAMTRAGKGQTIIEPTIDMWTREVNTNNMAINDPKGELYVKFYYPASMRGMDVIAFNLINPSRTNIYNPLGYAIEASRQGDNQKVEELVSSIGDVFFPTENADDPMWPNAANATFKRSALGLIDYYQEEEREMRLKASRENWNPVVLDQRLDEMWGRVTLYNVYQMMIELASKKSNDIEMIHLDDDDPSKEKDYLTLFFDATNKLPKNALRMSVANQDKSLRAMAGSEKTIASVYGISLTAMLFFADEKISRLTSGRPSQNFDIVGLGFPRRFGVRLDATYMDKMNFRGQRILWTAYRDKEFKNKYEGADFEHQSRVDSNGWCMYFFKGIFENRKTYLKLEIFDDVNGLRAKEFLFEFTKGYQTSMNGRTYVVHPVHKERIIHNGVLREMHRQEIKNRHGEKEKKLIYGASVIKRRRKSLVEKDNGAEIIDRVPIFIQNEVHYTESPKAVFFITPPHLMTYAKIILILINQMFNMQVDKAYLTKENQKPMYKTRYMLDEVGNLQSEGNGIPYLSTKESIGLGQEQQYTLILQTLQQLKDVYGDSVDKILQGNTGNTIYLKSTDDSMLDTLEKLAGTRHVAVTDSKTVTENKRALFNNVEGNVSRTTSMKEVPTITKNNMLYIPKCNAMVFGKGHPIWARNEMCMPMSWRLHQDQLHDPNMPKYLLETVPTSMNTDEFDVISNKPNFFDMVSKRVNQAQVAESVIEQYKKVYNLDDDGMSRVPSEQLAEALMRGINETIYGNDAEKAAVEATQAEDKSTVVVNMDGDQNFVDKVGDKKMITAETLLESAVENTELKEAQTKTQREIELANRKIYAKGKLSKNDLMPITPDLTGGDVGYRVAVNHAFDLELSQAYSDTIAEFRRDERFEVLSDGSLIRKDGGEVLIKNNSKELSRLQEEANNAENDSVRNLSDNTKVESHATYEIYDSFYKFLTGLNNWQGVANGRFDEAVAKAMARRGNEDNY